MKRQARKQVTVESEKTLSSDAMRNAQGGGLCCASGDCGENNCSDDSDDDDDSSDAMS